ncbi:deoxyribose-phosphate aldolase [Anaerofustis butyriciformans]|uniref:deoxyribose-phosphate aldolase n=1 Tax=Anaerofustis butyriciformans TaxID=3108533 RepID=UPI002E31FA1E|nr:deoxyribose-phosphate aldolase [Anaerofustis sp. HA2171]
MKKDFDFTNINRMVDVSTVRTDIVMDEVDEMIDTVIKYNCICASPMPWVTKYTIDKLKDYPDIVTTGVVSFPSGAATTANKIIEAKENIKMGCQELDMVSNVSALKSGKYDYFVDDIKAVVDAADGVPVKAIIEICYLTDDEIRKASELAVKAGVTYVKTGTGWGPKPTTVDTIKIIKETIGDDALIKAAGGVKDLDTVIEMIEAGCNRFGLGVRTAGTILEDAKKRFGE